MSMFLGCDMVIPHSTIRTYKHCYSCQESQGVEMVFSQGIYLFDGGKEY